MAQQIPDTVQAEVTRVQNRILTQYRKRLTPKFQKELQDFAMSGKNIGSSEYFKLSPLVKEVFVKISVETMDIYIKSTKNPFKKFQYWLAKVTTQHLGKVKKNPIKKKKKKK